MIALFVSRDIVKTAGPVAAVVHAVLVANDPGDGSVMSHKEIAAESGTNVSMARRSIDKLLRHGYVKVENQVEHMVGQQANRYQIPTWATPYPLLILSGPMWRTHIQRKREPRRLVILPPVLLLLIYLSLRYK